MRVWLLQGRQGEDPGGLRSVVRLWADRCGNEGWRLEIRPLGTDLSASVQAQRPEVLVFAAGLGPQRPGVEEILAAEVGLVVAAEDSQCESYRDLADRYPLLFVPGQPTVEEMTLALRGARAALRRQQYWKGQVEQLHQRLNDRIVIERAKGVLVQRLGIGEEEAYKRLRVLSRRQRRQIRDIAQSLLDTQTLLIPPANGFGPYDSLSGNSPPAGDDRLPEPPAPGPRGP
jgi:response regulator NasT